MYQIFSSARGGVVFRAKGVVSRGGLIVFGGFGKHFFRNHCFVIPTETVCQISMSLKSLEVNRKRLSQRRSKPL